MTSALTLVAWMHLAALPLDAPASVEPSRVGTARLWHDVDSAPARGVRLLSESDAASGAQEPTLLGQTLMGVLGTAAGYGVMALVLEDAGARPTLVLGGAVLVGGTGWGVWSMGRSASRPGSLVGSLLGAGVGAVASIGLMVQAVWTLDPVLGAVALLLPTVGAIIGDGLGSAGPGRPPSGPRLRVSGGLDGSGGGRLGIVGTF